MNFKIISGVDQIDKHIDLSEQHSLKATINKVVQAFDDNIGLLNKFLYAVLKSKILDVITSNGSIDINTIEDSQKIDSLIPKKKRGEILDQLKEELSVKTPDLHLPLYKKVLIAMMIVLPTVIILILLYFNIEILIVLWGYLSFGIFIMAALSIYLAVYFVYPDFFKKSEFVEVNNFSDLINEIVLLNRYKFYEKDFQLTRELLEDYIVQID